jgi:hypothetical protein
MFTSTLASLQAGAVPIQQPLGTFCCEGCGQAISPNTAVRGVLRRSYCDEQCCADTEARFDDDDRGVA